MNKQIILGIIEDINALPYFSDYKIRKKDCRLIKKMSNGYNAIEFQYWNSYDLERNCLACVVTPQYFVRFGILTKWFEKYSFKTLADQRDAWTVGFEGQMLGRVSEFCFREDGVDFEQDYNFMRDEVLLNSRTVFEKYRTLEDMYEYDVIPILEGNKPMPTDGADWAFEYLKLCRMVSPNDYERLKSLILERIEFMNGRGEPNIRKYYDKLDVILNDIETSTD